MFFYGYPSPIQFKETLILLEATSHKCPQCQEELYLTKFQRYLSLFYIPTFPYTKRSVLACYNCDTDFDHIESQLSVERSDPDKKPWWTWSGTILILFLIISPQFITTEKGRLKASIIASPQIGDVLVIRPGGHSKTPYQMIKIVKIDSHHIYINESTHSYSHIDNALRDAKYGVFYSESIEKLPLTELRSSIHIVDVIRQKAKNPVRQLIREAQTRRNLKID